MPQISNEALAERAKVNQLKPKLADVAKAMGQRIRYRTLPNGKREPYIKFTPNEAGKTTKAWGTAWEAVSPWAKADIERNAKINHWPGEYSKGLGRRRHTLMTTRAGKLYRVAADGLVPV